MLKKTYREQWPIGTDGVRELRESMLSACCNDDLCIYMIIT